MARSGASGAGTTSVSDDVGVSNDVAPACDVVLEQLDEWDRCDVHGLETLAIESRGYAGILDGLLDFLTHAQRSTATAVDHAPIATHVRDPRWAEEFGARIALLVNQRESVAAISLTPADLGPVDVNVTVRDSQATIHFGAAQAETRALLEASLPKLRELLAAQGFQLLDASVSQGFTRQTKPDAPSVPRPGVEEVTAVETRTVTLNGLLDTYA